MFHTARIHSSHQSLSTELCPAKGPPLSRAGEALNFRACVCAHLYMVTDDRSEQWLTLLLTSLSTSQSDEALIFRACVCVCTPEHGDRVSLISFVIKQFSGRGHRPVLDTCVQLVPTKLFQDGGRVV